MASEIRIIESDTEEDKMLNDLMVSAVCTGFVKVGPDNIVLPNNYTPELAGKINNFQVRNEDIFMAAHPKTGSTWLHDMVWLIANNLDYDRIAKEPHYIRLPCLESNVIVNVQESMKLLADKDTKFEEAPEDTVDVIKYIDGMQSPRNIKTHMHWSLLPEQIRTGAKTPRIIVPLRNPYDVCVSFYHHSKVMYKYTGNFEQFCQLFLAGRVYFAPYWKHVLGYWEQKHRSNILFVKYKDMKEDFPAVIRKVAEFLGKTLTDPEVVTLTKFLSFDNMKSNVHLNHETDLNEFYGKMNLITEKTAFIRSGIEGGYKSEMSPKIIAMFDEWVRKNLNGTDFTGF